MFVCLLEFWAGVPSCSLYQGVLHLGGVPRGDIPLPRAQFQGGLLSFMFFGIWPERYFRIIPLIYNIIYTSSFLFFIKNKSLQSCIIIKVMLYSTSLCILLPHKWPNLVIFLPLPPPPPHGHNLYFIHRPPKSPFIDWTSGILSKTTQGPPKFTPWDI